MHRRIKLPFTQIHFSCVDIISLTDDVYCFEIGHLDLNMEPKILLQTMDSLCCKVNVKCMVALYCNFYCTYTTLETQIQHTKSPPKETNIVALCKRLSYLASYDRFHFL